MPEIRHYVVTQTRQVEVSANSATDAARIANVAFEQGQNAGGGVRVNAISSPKLEGIWGNTDSPVREIEIDVKDQRYGK